MLSSTVKALLIASGCWRALALPSRAEVLFQSRSFSQDISTHFYEVASCQINLEPDTSDIANTSYVKWVKSATLPSGTTYRYVFSPPFEPEKPYLLFLHGFPDSSYTWVNQIDYFTRQGYGIIAPDLLGAGGTDNPADLQSFSYKNMVTELGELLDCEGVDQVIGVAHDFGSLLLSRVYTYQPNRLLALVLMDIGYLAPGQDLNTNFIYPLNNATAATLGYTVFGYWLFFERDDAASITDAHLDSFYSLVYTSNTTYFRNNFAQVGEFERWLLADRMAPYGGEYISKVTEEQWKSTARAQGGLGGGLKWYKAMMRGINTPDEQENWALPAAIELPVLLILADRDPVGLPSIQANYTVPYAANLQIRTVNSGHFVQLEAAQEARIDGGIGIALCLPILGAGVNKAGTGEVDL